MKGKAQVNRIYDFQAHCDLFQQHMLGQVVDE